MARRAFITGRARRIVLYALVYFCSGSVFLLPLTMPLLRSASDFSIYNTGWNGCSEFALKLFASGKEVYPLHAPFGTIRNRPGDARTALVVIGPTRPFTRSDANFTAGFVGGGGLLIVANDFDEGNSLLEGMGLDVRFGGEPAADLCFERDPAIVTCYAMADRPLTRNMSSFYLNRPTGLVGPLPPGSTLLARTSPMSWVDSNDDGVWQREGERRGPIPVMAEIPYGEGRIILLSDPSVFVNDMIARPGNERLMANLVSLMTGREIERIYIDEEHRVLTNPVELFTVVIRRAPDYGRLIIVWLMVTVIIFVVHPRLRRWGIGVFDATISLGLRILSLGAGRQVEADRCDPIQACLQKHPDWERTTMERIIRSSSTEAKP